MNNLSLTSSKESELTTYVNQLTGGAGILTYPKPQTALVTMPKSYTTRVIDCLKFDAYGFAVEIQTPDYYFKESRLELILKVMEENGIKPEESVISTTSLWQLYNPYSEETYYIVYHPVAEFKMVKDGISIHFTSKYINPNSVEADAVLKGIRNLKEARHEYIRNFNFFDKERAATKQRANYEKHTKGL